QIEALQASSDGSDQLLAWQLEQLQAQYAASQQEVTRLQAEGMELAREVGGWRRQAEFLEVRERSRHSQSYVSRSHRTRHVSWPSQRPREGSGEGGGEGSRAPH